MTKQHDTEEAESPSDLPSVQTINPHIPIRWTAEMMQAHFESMSAAEREGIDAMQRAAIEAASHADERE